MVGLSTSCDRAKLEQVMISSYLVMRGYYGLTREDKEDIMLDVMYRFEADKGRFPVTVYARHCKNKIVGFLGKKTAKKRMTRKVVNGKTIFIEDERLNRKIGEEQDMEYGDTIPVEDGGFQEVELLADMERKAPDLVPLLKKVLHGQGLSIEEKRLIKKVLSKEDLV